MVEAASRVRQAGRPDACSRCLDALRTGSNCTSVQVSGVRPLNHGCVGLLRPAYPYPGLAPVNVLSMHAIDEDRFGSGSAQCRACCLLDSELRL